VKTLVAVMMALLETLAMGNLQRSKPGILATLCAEHLSGWNQVSVLEGTKMPRAGHSPMHSTFPRILGAPLPQPRRPSCVVSGVLKVAIDSNSTRKERSLPVEAFSGAGERRAHHGRGRRHYYYRHRHGPWKTHHDEDMHHH